MTSPLLVSIDYDEGDAGSYRAVRLMTSSGQEVERWDSGNPEDDWSSYNSWLAQNSNTPVKIASSVKHFLWDVPGWEMMKNKNSQDILVPINSRVAV